VFGLVRATCLRFFLNLTKPLCVLSQLADLTDPGHLSRDVPRPRPSAIFSQTLRSGLHLVHSGLPFKFLAERYYVTFGLWHDAMSRPSVVCLSSVTLLNPRQRLVLFVNILQHFIAQGLGQFVL